MCSIVVAISFSFLFIAAKHSGTLQRPAGRLFYYCGHRACVR
jgi:hypothetical protein